MTRLKHNFINKFSNLYSFIPSGATCNYCGISADRMYSTINSDIVQTLSDCDKRLLEENSMLNKFYPCLTEEEYIIKKIIE